MTKYLFVISVIDSNAKPWEGFNVGHDKRCKVTYVAPAGSQLTINFLDMDMAGEGAGEEDCNKDYMTISEPTKRPHGSIGGLTKIHSLLSYN